MIDAPPLTEQDTLLRAVAAAPDDDAPRLAYADWLEIDAPRGLQDPARAAFIRVQLELARLEPDKVRVGTIVSQGGWSYRPDVLGRNIPAGVATKAQPHPVYDALREWEAKVSPKLRHKWAAGHALYLLPVPHRSPAIVRSDVTVAAVLHHWAHTLVEFRRGFPEVLVIDWGTWRHCHERIREWVPVREVRLATRPPEFEYRGVVDEATDARMRAYFGRHWPGIRFATPPAGISNADLAAMRDSFRRHFLGLTQEELGQAERFMGRPLTADEVRTLVGLVARHGESSLDRYVREMREEVARGLGIPADMPITYRPGAPSTTSPGR